MIREKILVVDDEKDIIELLKYNLEREGFRVISSHNGEDALGLVRNESPDLVILDLMLPGLDGLEVCRALRRKEETSHIPIIMLTAKTTEPDIIVGLELGADDYITKPFRVGELVARVRAVLRRVSHPGDSAGKLVVGDLAVDPAKYQATWRGDPVDLTTTEFNLLFFLAQRQEKVMTRQQILDGVLGDDSFVTERTVDVHIQRLRKKLDDASSCIVTRRGIGYMFREDALKEGV